MTHKHPLIGITGNFGDKGCELAEGYYLSVIRAGGTPIIIPPHKDKEALVSLLGTLDGIILSGGSDINPLLLGEEPIPQLHSVCPERDEPELFLAREAFHRQIPTLGICRGIQVLAASLGGTVWQDIYAQGAGAKLKHSQEMPRHYASHSVTLKEDSLLHSIFGGNTRNHLFRQAVNHFNAVLK